MAVGKINVALNQPLRILEQSSGIARERARTSTRMSCHLVALADSSATAPYYSQRGVHAPQFGLIPSTSGQCAREEYEKQAV